MMDDKDFSLSDPVTHRELEYVLRPLLDGLMAINTKLDELRNHREDTIVKIANLETRVEILETQSKDKRWIWVSLLAVILGWVLPRLSFVAR